MGVCLAPCGFTGVLSWMPTKRVAVEKELASDVFSPTAGNCSKRKPPNSFHQRYALTQKLGKGSFATVYSISDAQHSDLDLAVKVVELAKFDVSNEVEIMRKASQSKYCIELVDYFLEGDLGYIVMERCDLEFYELLRSETNLNERSFAPLTHDMFAALADLQDFLIIHRDIKPENFLFSSRSKMLKLCDFGMSACLNPEEPFTKGLRGTTPFMSPEMLMRKPYGVETDVWSLGVLMYAILLGHFPYTPPRPDSLAMIRMIIANSPVPSFRPAAAIDSPSVLSIDLLRSLITHDPLTRAKAKEALHHAWFRVSDKSDHCSHPMMRGILSARRVGAFSLKHMAGSGAIDTKLIKLQSAFRGSMSFLRQPHWSRQSSLASTAEGSEGSDTEN